jgi:hypothetical protein
MRKYLPLTIGIAGMLLAGPALARNSLEMATVKAASDCVTAAALNNPKITELHSANKLRSVTDRIVLKSGVCNNQLTAMRLLHDRIYGAGTGQLYLRGRYLSDLPRAVDERLRIEAAKRLASKRGDDDRAAYAMDKLSERAWGHPATVIFPPCNAAPFWFTAICE